jgi:DNA-binding transcriptional LysR family regulator
MSRPDLDSDKHISRHVKLRELHILSTVIERGSMARAAGHLAMTQSAVSEAIAKFEASLCVRLLNRTSRGVEPTVYAKAILDRGRVVFNELRQGLRDIEFLSDPTAGEVRVGAPESLSAGLVPAIIERLSRDYPKVRVHVVQANTASLEFRELREHNLDFMIGRIPDDLNEQDLHLDILFQDDNFIVAGVGSRWARRRKIALKELATEPWILPSSTNIMTTLVEQIFRTRGLTMPQNSVTANSIHLRLHLLATGRFVSLLPRSVLRYNAHRWSLKALPIELTIEPRPVAIVTLNNRTLRPVANRFIECAREVGKSLGIPLAHRA